jgi:hypothetical protein
MLSAFADRIGLDALVTFWGILDGNSQGVVTGTVGEFEAADRISLVSEPPLSGIRFSLRKTTAYEGSPTDIKPGVRVTVWYRSIGERRLVADKVRVLAAATTR